MTYALMLRGKRDAIVAEIKDLLATTEAEQRAFTPAEHKRAKSLDYEADKLADSIKRAERADELAAMSADMRGQTGTIVEGPASKMTDTLDARTLTDMMTEVRYQGFSARDFPHPEGVQLRALQSAGGSAFAGTFIETLTMYQRTATPMLDPTVVSILNVGTGESRTFPRLTADVAHGGTVTAEAAAIAELDPTLSSVSASPFKYAAITNWSGELDTDNVIRLDRVVAASTGRELALDIGTHLTTGTGTTQPFGFVTECGNGGTATGGTATQGFDFVAPADLSKLYMSLASPYRSVGTWQVATGMLEKILAWRDSDGVPIALPLAESPSGLGIYGRPLVENPALAAPASATRSVAFGDFSAFTVVRLPLRVELSRDYKWSTDQVSLRVIERVDGRLIDTSAVKFLVSADS